MTELVETFENLHETLRLWRCYSETVGFVPTMGALHDGHLSLVKESQRQNDRTIVSIFVNPLQFGPYEGLGKYPRMPKDDAKILNAMGCDLLYVPHVEEMYRDGFVTKVDPGPLANILEGVFRPKHFAGVATIMTKFLMQIMPDRVYFGDKDYQQLLIMKQIIRDLFMPVEAVSVPVARDGSGLAHSTRNVFLTGEQRRCALVLPTTLHDVAAKLLVTDDLESVLDEGRRRIDEAGLMLEYLELRDAATLGLVTELTSPARLLVAAKIGSTRLLDNLPVEPVKALDTPLAMFQKRFLRSLGLDDKEASDFAA